MHPDRGLRRSRPSIPTSNDRTSRDVAPPIWSGCKNGSTSLPVARLFLAADPQVMAVLADRAAAGVKERICLRTQMCGSAYSQNYLACHPTRERCTRRYISLNECGEVETRVSRVQPSSYIYRTEGECLVAPRVYGTSDSRTPLMHLRKGTGGIFPSYIRGFEAIWTSASTGVNARYAFMSLPPAIPCLVRHPASGDRPGWRWRGYHFGLRPPWRCGSPIPSQAPVGARPA